MLHRQFIFSLGVTLALAGCGGGGGSTVVSIPTFSIVPPTWATSGAYSPVLKLQGSSKAVPLVMALSLVHASNPGVEYVMDTVAAPTMLGFSLEQGTYDPVTHQVAGLTPVAYVDAPSGTVRTTSLLATPSGRPTQLKTVTTNLCSESIEARNFATPFASQIAIATHGKDSACGTADDGVSLITFSTNGQPTVGYTRDSTKMLGYLRDSTTGQPTYWLQAASSGEVTLVSMENGTPVSLDAASSTAKPVFQALASLGDSILFTKDGMLQSVSNTSGNAKITSLSTSAGPDGWKLIAADADHIHAYLNSDAAASGSGTWTVLSISRTSQVARTLATGSGSIFSGSASDKDAFVTTLTGASANVVQISKSSGAKSTFVASSTTSIPSLMPQPGGLSLLMVVERNGAYTSSILDEQGQTIYGPVNQIVYGIDQSTFDTLGGSSARSAVFLTTVNPVTWASGSKLVRYDLATRTVRTIGTFPTGLELGGFSTDPVFAGPVVPYPGFGATHLSRVVSGQLQSIGSAVYTYKSGVENSLQKTTVQVK